jgi:hypothetical protein
MSFQNSLRLSEHPQDRHTGSPVISRRYTILAGQQNDEKVVVMIPEVMQKRPSPTSPDGEIIAGTKNAGDKKLATERRTAKRTDHCLQLQRTFVFGVQAILDFIQKNNSSSHNQSNNGPRYRQAKGQDRTQEVRTCELPPPLMTDSFCFLGAQDPLVLRLATESSSPRRLLC